MGLITGLPGLRIGGWALAMTSFFSVILIPDLTQIIPGIGGSCRTLRYTSGETFWRDSKLSRCLPSCCPHTRSLGGTVQELRAFPARDRAEDAARNPDLVAAMDRLSTG